MIVEGLMMVLIIILAIKVWRNEDRLDLINEEVEDFIAETRELKQRCDAYKELIEALSKSVRELNGVVEAAVKVKEETSDNKPDTKALMGGWTTDEGQARIDASHISTGMIDGQSLMNCELPNLSESAREKIFELLGVKVPEKEKPADATHISTGTIMMWHGRSVNECGRLADGTVVWRDKDGRLYVGDAKPYEMDQ